MTLLCPPDLAVAGTALHYGERHSRSMNTLSMQRPVPSERDSTFVTEADVFRPSRLSITLRSDQLRSPGMVLMGVQNRIRSTLSKERPIV